MFATHELELGVSCPAAQARLVNLAYGNGLSGASRDAYEGGFAPLIRVGPLGDVPGASKLVRVRFLDPVYRGGAMTLGLRWEATGMSGGLFPVLDADLTLTPAGEHTTRLALTGSYRPPLGRLGAGLDRAILHQAATATIRSLVHNIADQPRPRHAAPGSCQPLQSQAGQRTRGTQPNLETIELASACAALANVSALELITVLRWRWW